MPYPAYFPPLYSFLHLQIMVNIQNLEVMQFSGNFFLCIYASNLERIDVAIVFTQLECLAIMQNTQQNKTSNRNTFAKKELCQ